MMDYIGDTPDDTEEMRTALGEYLAAAMNAGEALGEAGGVEFSADTYAWVSGEGEVLTFIAATDVEVGRGLRASLDG